MSHVAWSVGCVLVCDRGLYQLVPDYGSPARSSRLFSEGQHYVEYRAVDAAGDLATCSFTVTVHGAFSCDDSVEAV